MDEWRSLSSLAIRQRVAGLLTLACGPLVPTSVREALAGRARRSALRTLGYQSELVRLVREVEPHGAELIVLKGLHLATAVYPSPALREMNDIDVLVRPEHIELVAAAAVKLGYQPMQETDVDAAMRVRHHLPRFIKEGAGLEIHWRLAPEGQAPLADPGGLWERAHPLTLATNTRVLSPEDTLLHICAHATISHFFEQGIRPLCDLRALLEKHQLSWETVGSRAAEWKCERGVSLVLQLTRDLLGVEIPPAALPSAGRVAPPGEVVSWAVGLIFSNTAAGVSEPAGRLIAVPSVAGRLGYAWSRVTLSPDQLAVMYPSESSRGPVAQRLLRGRRLWDLSGKYALNLARLALRPGGDAREVVDRRNALAAWLRDE